MSTTMQDALTKGVSVKDLLARIQELESEQPINDLLAKTADDAEVIETTAVTPAPRVNGKAKAAKGKPDTYKAMVAFAHLAIRKLRAAEGHKSKGIHAVYSGFNAAFAQQFSIGKEAVIAATNAMRDKGDLAIVPAKGGVMLYLPGEKPERSERNADSVLAKILG